MFPRKYFLFQKKIFILQEYLTTIFGRSYLERRVVVKVEFLKLKFYYQQETYEFIGPLQNKTNHTDCVADDILVLNPLTHLS